VAWRLHVTRTMTLPSRASFSASAAGRVRGSLSLAEIALYSSSRAMFSSAVTTAMIIGRFRVEVPMVSILIFGDSEASFLK